MKKTFLSLALITSSLVLFSFTKKSTTEIYKVDTEKSTIGWIGRKVAGDHKGNIKLLSGVLNTDGNTIQSGSFAIDMNSMTCSDLQGEWNAKLIGHLKSDDFFAVDKHPKANFEITKINPSTANKLAVSGKLTIKGVTQNISFIATVKQKDNALVAIAEGVKVDRTKYGIKYSSKSFFENLGDKVIDDEFELSITLVATK